MNNTYNSNMYLTKNDLNDIEDMVESLTEEIQDEIFNSTSSPLRNIQVGDNLNQKTIYAYFPNNIYESISGSDNIFIETDNNYKFNGYVDDFGSFDLYNIALRQDNASVVYMLYRKRSDRPNIMIRRYSVKIGDIGIVTSIDTNNPLYQYIKIYDNERIIPNYIKHVWNDNEFLSMQKVDNIIQGIKNIGYYYYKPSGWINLTQWLAPMGTNIRNISYRDLNIWLNNLNLINFNNLDKMTIWNSSVSEIDWNEENDTDWEEL